jgi:transposase
MAFCGSRISMKKIREILRLKYGDPPFSHREIGMAVNLSASTVGDVVLRFNASGLRWPLSPELDDAALERHLYASKRAGVVTSKVMPDWKYVLSELKRKNVTLALLWDEYKSQHGENGYEYSRFCQCFAQWHKRLNLSMRQVHRYGEKCFVDFAGQTVPILDSKTGEVVTEAQIFVGVLGGSNYTYAEATGAQDLPCWIQAHVRMLQFFGGAPQIVVPDNLKSGVTKPDYYDPVINPTYQEWAEHYSVAVLPTRVRKPKDKAKAEVAVQLVQRWILAALRNRMFYNLDELNEAIGELLVKLNRKRFKKVAGSREQLWTEHERAELRPLPDRPYDFGLWSRQLRVPFDYHISAGGRLYSVPHPLADQKVEVRLSASFVEVFHQHQRVASHRRRFGSGPPITLPEHMPSHHRAQAEWTAERVLNWASQLGTSVRQFCDELMQRRAHPEQGFRTCLGVIRLAKQFGDQRLDAACRKAIRIQSFSYKSVKSMLISNLQDQPERVLSLTAPEFHENVRGATYYTN